MKTTVAALAVALLCGVSFGQETKEMPKEVREHLQKLQGRWKLSGNAGDKKYTLEYTVTWSPDKNCVFASWSGTMANEPMKGSAAIGWDALKQEVVEFQFTNEGVCTVRSKIKSPGVLEGEWDGVLLGKKAKTTDTFEWLGPNEFKITTKAANKALAGVLNGQRMEGRP